MVKKEIVKMDDKKDQDCTCNRCQEIDSTLKNSIPAYKLTLSKQDREAIDWVGYRYSNGDELYTLLYKCDYISEHKTSCAWDSKSDITFLIPEYIAWEIAENAEQEDGDYVYNFPCFANEFADKLRLFCENLV